MKRFIALILMSIILCCSVSGYASTLETTTLAFELNYAFAMTKLGYTTDMTSIETKDSVMYFLTDNCIAVMSMEDSEIKSAVHIGFTRSNDMTDEVSASMVAMAMSFDPSMSKTKEVTSFLVGLIKNGSDETEYCAYQFAYNEETSIYTMIIAPK